MDDCFSNNCKYVTSYCMGKCNGKVIPVFNHENYLDRQNKVIDDMPDDGLRGPSGT